LQITAYDLTVSPISNISTEFDVSNADGKVKIMALKGDATISDDSGTSPLPQGQQTTREASLSKKKRHNWGAAPTAGGGLLDSPIVVGVGAAAIRGLVIWVACQSLNPASPKNP
jgi:hypothetical protein